MKKFKDTPSSTELRKMYSTQYSAVKNNTKVLGEECDLAFSELMLLAYLGTADQDTAIYHVLNNMKRVIRRYTREKRVQTNL